MVLRHKGFGQQTIVRIYYVLFAFYGHCGQKIIVKRCSGIGGVVEIINRVVVFAQIRVMLSARCCNKSRSCFCIKYVRAYLFNTHFFVQKSIFSKQRFAQCIKIKTAADPLSIAVALYHAIQETSTPYT